LRTMLREIASGGKFFKKLAIPKLILPVIAKIEPIFRAAQERGDLKRELDPLYTFLQIIGGIVFFNIIQIPMQGTVLEERAFQGDYAARFEENLMGILKNGIESGEKRR